MSDKNKGGRKELDRIEIAKRRRGSNLPLQNGHSHNFFELFYVNSGKCGFLLKDNLYRLSKGDLVLIAPGELHHAIYDDEDTCEIIILMFKLEHVNLEVFDNPHSFMGSIPDLYMDDLTGLFSKMLSESSRIDKYSDTYLGLYLSEILLLLMRHSVMNEEDPEMINSKDAEILKATRYIYGNFRRPLTLEEVSDIASLSPSYFSRKFKQTTGMGFKEYLNYVRLKHAQTALLTTDSTITDIALEYGFNDSNYFKDLFKKIYGKSPREYRKSMAESR